MLVHKIIRSPMGWGQLYQNSWTEREGEVVLTGQLGAMCNGQSAMKHRKALYQESWINQNTPPSALLKNRRGRPRTRGKRWEGAVEGAGQGRPVWGLEDVVQSQCPGLSSPIHKGS